MENLDLKSLWNDALSKLENEFGQDAVEMWLRPVKPLFLENNTLKLEIPNQVWYQTLRERYEAAIKAFFSKAAGAETLIEYSVPVGANVPPQPEPRQETQPRTAAAFPSRLNPNYTFGGFIEGPSNRFAYKAAQAVVKKLGDRANNPLVIYSSPGLGKTHILHSIGNEIIANSRSARLLYMSGEEFVGEYIASLQNKTSESFRKKYRNLDCFLVDDIQFVAGKEVSEKEFFYTFNALFESKKQIVLTSDRTPNELAIDERLASRLLSGLLAEIKPPDLETRIAILRKKREIHNYNIPDDVISFVAENVKNSIRELEGSLYQLDSYCTYHALQPTIDVAKVALKGVIEIEDKPLSASINTIKKVVARHFKIEIEDFTSKKKTHSISWPRQIAMYLANEMTEFSLPEIGRAFDRDHSTVVHARDQVKKEIAENPFFAAEMNQIITDIKAVDSM